MEEKKEISPNSKVNKSFESIFKVFDCNNMITATGPERKSTGFYFNKTRDFRQAGPRRSSLVEEKIQKQMLPRSFEKNKLFTTAVVPGEPSLNSSNEKSMSMRKVITREAVIIPDSDPESDSENKSSHQTLEESHIVEDSDPELFNDFEEHKAVNQGRSAELDQNFDYKPDHGSSQNKDLMKNSDEEEHKAVNQGRSAELDQNFDYKSDHDSSQNKDLMKNSDEEEDATEKKVFLEIIEKKKSQKKVFPRSNNKVQLKKNKTKAAEKSTLQTKKYKQIEMPRTGRDKRKFIVIRGKWHRIPQDKKKKIIPNPKMCSLQITRIKTVQED